VESAAAANGRRTKDGRRIRPSSLVLRLSFRSAVASARAALAGAPYLAAALAIGLVALVAGLLFTIQTPYQVLLPGPVTDVQRVIHPYPKPIKGALYLTTIYSDPASVGEWLYAKANPHAGIVPREEARPKNVDEKQYEHALAVMMDESKVAAKVVALRNAGYDVQLSGDGVLVLEVADYSKAKGVLQPGDVITAADGQPVTTANDLVALIQARRPTDTIRLRVKRGETEQEVTIALVEAPDEPGRARAGVAVQTHQIAYHFPRDVDLATKDIGGPSAGLMFALGVYNAVAPTDITKGHKIAGTGTISTDGRVGAVGGVKYKVFAAERAGAEIFLAPQDNAEEAKRAAGQIRVVSVADFNAALAALAALPSAAS
jgi:PDZ domain-containing protein